MRVRILLVIGRLHDVIFYVRISQIHCQEDTQQETSTLGVLYPVRIVIAIVDICCNISRRGLSRVAYPWQGNARALTWDRQRVEYPRLSHFFQRHFINRRIRVSIGTNILMFMDGKGSKLEIKKEAFYVKQEQKGKCKYAYLKLCEDPNEIFLAIFENRESEAPTIFLWNEKDLTKYNESKRIIVEFIGEAYLSLYISNQLEPPTDEPLWKEVQPIDSLIPDKWKELVRNIR